jgi:stage III sporulation protein AG
MTKLKDNKFVAKILKNKKASTVLIIILAILLVVSLFLSFGNKTVIKSSESVKIDYVTELENRLSETLSKVENAGKVSVVITLKSGMQTVLAMEKTTTETSSGRVIKETPIIVNGKTVVLKELYPEVSGVLIVCEGAKNISVYNKIQQATMSLFDIKAEQIEILSMK